MPRGDFARGLRLDNWLKNRAHADKDRQKYPQKAKNRLKAKLARKTLSSLPMALVWTLFARGGTSWLNRYIVFAGGLLLVIGLKAAALEPTTSPAPVVNPPVSGSGAKFLFIVETSAVMKRFEHDGRQVVFDLVYSGISNQMQSGDTYGVWTFSEQVSAGVYPMQVWSGDASLDQASRIGVFLKTDQYRGKPQADLAIAKALTVVKAVKNLTVVLVTSGDSSLGNSDLELKLRDTYHRKAEVARQQKVPVVLTFCSTDGEIALAMVTLAGENIPLKGDLLAKARQPIKKPELDAKSVVPAVAAQTRVQPIIMIGQPKPAPIAATPTIAPGTVTKTGEVNPALPASAGPGSVSVLPNEKVSEPESKPVLNATSTEPPKAVIAAAKSLAGETASTGTKENAKAGEQPAKHQEASNFLPTPLSVAAREPEPTARTAKTMPEPVVATTIASPARSGWDARLIMFLGTGFVAALLGFTAWAVYRRKNREASYISRAMSRR
jgi:hypothetical protein